MPGEDQILADDVGGDESVESGDEIGSKPIVWETSLAQFVMFEFGILQYFFKNVQRQMWFLINDLSDDFNDLAFKYLVIVDKPFNQ